MTEQAILDAVQEIFRDNFDDDTLVITRSTCADDIEDWDSLEQINLLTAIEKKFNIKFKLADVRGLMLDPDDESTLLTNLKVSEVPRLMRDGVIKGGMIPKVDCCVEAVRKGVDQANIQDGRVKHSILIELLSKVGVGTMFQ